MQNKQHTTTANDGGITASNIDTAGNTRDNLIVESGNLRAAAVDNENNMEMLQKRLVTLQNEVATMQKKVEGARHKVDFIKKNGIAVITADSKNIAGKGTGVVSVSLRYVFPFELFPNRWGKKESSKHSDLSLSLN